MRAALGILAVGLSLLAALPGAAQTDDGSADYRIDIDQKNVLSAIRERDGQRGLFVSLQFQIKRLRDDGLVTDVPREEIVVEEDGQRVAGLEVLQPRGQKLTVVLAIDSAAADGRDVSWLWDVDYEQLAGRSVVATGPRAQDLAVRLMYAGVEHRCVPDLAAALAGHRESVDVIATYTPFQRLRKMGGV